MAKYREQMKKLYFDPTKYKTYLEQFGINTRRSRSSRRLRLEARGLKREGPFEKNPAAPTLQSSSVLHCIILNASSVSWPSAGGGPDRVCGQSAQVIGDVEIGTESSVWMNAVVRGDVNCIRIGARSNVQDGTVIHVHARTNPTTSATT